MPEYIMKEAVYHPSESDTQDAKDGLEDVFRGCRYHQAYGEEDAEGESCCRSARGAEMEGDGTDEKQRLDIKVNMPQRRFIGPSRELRDMTREEVTKEITNILTK